MDGFEYLTDGTFEVPETKRRQAWGSYRIGNGLVCTVWMEPRASVWEVAGATIHAERDEVAVGPVQRTRIGLQAVTTDLVAEGGGTTDEPSAVTARLLRDLPLGAIAADLRGRIASNQPRFAPDIERRPGRRRQPDEFYAEVAAAYVAALEAGSRSPAKDLARARSYSASMVNNWIHTARQRGLLTSPPPGRAGGYLTDRARALLAEEDEDA